MTVELLEEIEEEEGNREGDSRTSNALETEDNKCQK